MTGNQWIAELSTQYCQELAASAAIIKVVAVWPGRVQAREFFEGRNISVNLFIFRYTSQQARMALQSGNWQFNARVASEWA